LLRELDKNGVSIDILHRLSYKSSLGKSLANSLRRFDKTDLFKDSYLLSAGSYTLTN